MSRFVLDNTITMAWCFNDEATTFTEALLSRLSRLTDSAVVPALWLYEVVNVSGLAVRIYRVGSDRCRVERRAEISTQLPVFWIAPSMETGNYHDSGFFDEKEQPVREPTHSGPPPSSFHYGKMQGLVDDSLDGVHHASAKRCASSGRMLSYRASASLSSASATGSQTTGSFTVS